MMPIRSNFTEISPTTRCYRGEAGNKVQPIYNALWNATTVLQANMLYKGVLRLTDEFVYG